jgi:neutral ceramidase
MAISGAATRLEVGVAKSEITTYEPNLGMMGWGMLDNIVQTAATPLHARAFVLRSADKGTKLAIVVCELAFPTLALRDAICRRLAEAHPETGLELQQVMVLATHTHSGPGGFTHYPFYNVTIPGFAPKVLAGLADKIAGCIAAADRARVPAVMRYGESEFDVDSEVAFNRSIAAYNSNPDVTPVVPERRTLALDRTMRMIRFDAKDGTPLGSINWFAVHCTSVHSDNTALHFDNKGYAAQFVEEEFAGRGHEGYVAAFAQGATGDVTPNFRRHPGRPWVRGKYADDDQSARYNGRLQADKALEILEASQKSSPMPLRLGLAHAFVDMSDVEVDPEYTGGRTGCRTAPAEIGMAMFFGTEEGPGLPRQLLFLQDVASALRPLWRRVRERLPGAPDYGPRDASQGEKIPWVESARHRILGVGRLSRLPLPWSVHPALRLVRKMDTNGSDAPPWTPNVMPIQLIVIGTQAIAAVPNEFTTVSGRRLRATVQGILTARGVEGTILAGYANAYSGYVTTPEEYAYQDYEGASTHFGKWTLPAYQTLFARLARDLVADRDDRIAWPDVKPPAFPEHDLAQRTFPA